MNEFGSGKIQKKQGCIYLDDMKFEHNEQKFKIAGYFGEWTSGDRATGSLLF